MGKKLIKTVTQTFIKGETYNFADGDLNLPKHDYTTYFEILTMIILMVNGKQWIYVKKVLK